MNMGLSVKSIRGAAIALLFFLSLYSLQAQQLAGNWQAVPMPDTKSDAFFATDLPIWKVQNDGKQIIASRWTRQDRKDRETTSLPGLLKRDPQMKGYPVSLKLAEGGWLVGFDGGEWGGGLWSTSEDGSQTINILPNENIHALFNTPDGVLVLSGVAHLSIDRGKAWLVPNSSWANANARELCDLDGSPQASLQDSRTTLLVVTNKAVSRVNSSGIVEKIIELPNIPLIANSIAVATDGTIYIGIRSYILRVSPKPPGYNLEWLAKIQNPESSKPSTPDSTAGTHP